MNIKQIHILNINGSSTALQAVASVEFTNGLVFHDIKIIKKQDNRLWILMPSKRYFYYADDTQGIFLDVAHPINRESLQKLETEIINCYNRAKGNSNIYKEILNNEVEDINITDIHLDIPRYPNSPSNYLMQASITIDNSYCIHDIKIIKHNNELFIAFPSRKTNNNEYKDLVHPTKKEVREKISNAILMEYRERIKKNEINDGYKKQQGANWIKNKDIVFTHNIDKWTELLKYDNAYDEQELSFITNNYSEDLAECIEHFLKGIILCRCSVNIPDDIKEVYRKKYGVELALSEEEEVAFFTGYSNEEFFKNYNKFKNLRDLTGNCFKKLKDEDSNKKILNLFAGRKGHILSALINTLPIDEQKFLIREMSFNPLFKQEYLPDLPIKINSIISNNNSQIKYSSGTIVKHKIDTYPNTENLENLDLESKKRLENVLKCTEKFHILFDELCKPEISNAFVDGRYYSELYKANFKLLYMLCIASRKLINRVYDNAIEIGHKKFIFPDKNSDIIVYERKKQFQT